MIPRLDPELLGRALRELPDRRWAALLAERFGLESAPALPRTLRQRYYPDLDELAFRRRLKTWEAQVLSRMAQLMAEPD